MNKWFKFIFLAVFLFFIQLNPTPANACVEGLSWGMDLSSVEKHLGAVSYTHLTLPTSDLV